MNATLFQDINFAGASVALSGDVPDLRSSGAQWNDAASSVKVPTGGSVQLFEDINFAGQSLTLTADAPDLRSFPGPGADGTWNDVASSAKVAEAVKVERLKLDGKFVECSAAGAITRSSQKTAQSVAVITQHDDKRFDACFPGAGRLVLSVQSDGSLQTRPAGSYGPFEQLSAISTPAPDAINLIYRVLDGAALLGPVFQIVED